MCVLCQKKNDYSHISADIFTPTWAKIVKYEIAEVNEAYSRQELMFTFASIRSSLIFFLVYTITWKSVRKGISKEWREEMK